MPIPKRRTSFAIRQKAVDRVAGRGPNQFTGGIVRHTGHIWALALAIALGGQGLVPPSPAWGASTPVTVGVLAYQGADRAEAEWRPTARYLDRALPGHVFRLEFLDLSGMRRAVRDKALDFVITNAGNYVELEATFGISRIATLESTTGVDPGRAVGSVIVTAANDTAIRTLDDLKGKRLAAVAPDAFGGFEVARRELARHGIAPFTDLASLRFTGFPMEQVLFAVRDGKADAGIVRACLPEQVGAAGRIDPTRFRVLNPRYYPGFDCALSSRLYPDWAFAKLKDTSRELAKKVAQALLAMPPSAPAARAGGYFGWTIPVDYQPVHELLRELKIAPYDQLRRNTLRDLFYDYWHWLFVAAAAIVWWVLHGARVGHLVRVRTAELSAANRALQAEITERRRAEERAHLHQEELNHVSRLSILGEMASNLAHELNQPLAAIMNYARGAARRLETGNADPQLLREVTAHIAEQAGRAGTIIQRIRGFVRKREPQRELLDINQAVGEAIELFEGAARRQGGTVRRQLAPRLPLVCADRIEVQQVLLNLLQNGLDAMTQSAAAERVLAVSTALGDDGQVRVDVTDRGQGLAEGSGERLFQPFFTTKPAGVGLGLSISKSIVESHGGRIWASPNPEGGLTMSFTLSTSPGSHDAQA